MSGYYDVYSLAPSRTTSTVHDFLNRFVPQRIESCDEFPIPHFVAQPVAIFHSSEEVMDWCVQRPTEYFSLYWNSTKLGDPTNAMAFFTSDGGLILGLSVVNDPQRWLLELNTHMGGISSFIGFEEAPPSTVREFLREAASRDEKGLSRE